MKASTKTPDRILAAGRRIFNEKGYAAATLTEIAADVGISQGNLTYHFPTKRELAKRLEADARKRAQERRALYTSGAVADDYVEHLLAGMELTWDNRFLLRDRAQNAKDLGTLASDSELSANYQDLRQLVERIREEDLFRRDGEIDLEMLTRSLWIVSRYWMDYLREFEGLERISWPDQERGIDQHFAVLLPCLTAAAKRDFTAALARRSEQLGIGSSNL